jgi:hypothetical protein
MRSQPIDGAEHGHLHGEPVAVDERLVRVQEPCPHRGVAEDDPFTATRSRRVLLGPLADHVRSDVEDLVRPTLRYGRPAGWPTT